MKITKGFSLKFWHESASQPTCGFALCPEQQAAPGRVGWPQGSRGSAPTHPTAAPGWLSAAQGRAGQERGLREGSLSESPHTAAARAPRDRDRAQPPRRLQGLNATPGLGTSCPCRKASSPEHAGSPRWRLRGKVLEGTSFSAELTH